MDMVAVMLIDHMFSLQGTSQAWQGLVVATLVLVAGAVAAAVLAAYRPRPARTALVCLLAGGLSAGLIVEATYQSWFNHRCVEHHSDIPECPSPEPDIEEAPPGAGPLGYLPDPLPPPAIPVEPPA